MIETTLVNSVIAVGQLSEESANIKWNDHNEVREKMWNPYFGNSLRNDRGLSELSFPYVLRHTQMRPLDELWRFLNG